MTCDPGVLIEDVGAACCQGVSGRLRDLGSVAKFHEGPLLAKYSFGTFVFCCFAEYFYSERLDSETLL